MKRLIVSLILTLFLSAQVLAAPIEIKILTKTEIAQLSDQQLMDNYVEALVDLETAKTFYGRAGFQPKEIKTFKDLVRYRLYLILEMQNRKMEVPDLE